MNYYNVLLAKQTNKIEYFGSLYDCLFEKWINRAKQILKDLPTGSISTVNDAAELPLNALKVSVDAVQDLHGYDHPWVGGAGKNKLPLILSDIKSANTSGTWSGDTYTVNGISFTVNTDNGGNIESVKATGTASNSAILFLRSSRFSEVGNYVLNGCPSGGANDTYSTELYIRNPTVIVVCTGEDVNFEIPNGGFFQEPLIVIRSGYAIPSGGIIFYPMIRLATETDPTFAPYSNISPIEGWDSGEIAVCDDIQSPTQTETTTLDFPTTIYGAEWDVVSGELKATDGYIASYNGESLPSTWISDRDVYASGTTPTIGAEVVYKLATPTTIDLSPLSIRMLEGTNNLYADCGEILSGKYWANV